MEVRELKTSDIPAIIHLGGRMHEESQYSPLDYAPEKVAGRCQQAIEATDMMAVVAESGGEVVGILAGYVAEYQYGADLIAQDLLVYVEPEHRGSTAFVRMVREYVRWAMSKGAAIIFLAQTTGVNQARVHNLYQRLGFAPVGGIYAMKGKG